jgi:hypothetical protein
MAFNQIIGTADFLYAGRGYDSGLYGVQKMKGRPVSLLTKVDLGAPKLAVAAGIINAATSTELPNATTITYTAATQGTAPLDPVAALGSATIQTIDGSRTCMVLDVPRNVTAAINTSVNAITITVTGYDQYRGKIVETLSIAQGGTAAVGKKAFKYIYSIAITAVGDETAKTLSVGFGSVLGLPFYLAEKSDLLSVWFDDAVDSSTVVAGVTTTPSATTGDVRGTITIAGTLNGTKTLKAWMHVSDENAGSRNGLLGKVNYAG